MEWRRNRGVEWLEAELPGAKAVFSTRSAGSVKQSHAPLTAALGISPDRIAAGRQVHGGVLAFPRQPGDAPEADGQVIREPGLTGLVYVADCLPVAVTGPGGVAILHCGWRGLAAGIAARGSEAVDGTHAAIGPGIGPCCYEVGEEVLAAFSGLGSGFASEGMLDLSGIAEHLLRQAGVAEIESAGLCTCCERDRFFSHRRDGEPGRQAGLVWLEPPMAEAS